MISLSRTPPTDFAIPNSVNEARFFFSARVGVRDLVFFCGMTGYVNRFC
jgi:hypothetical protein